MKNILLALLLPACSIHTQGPIREVPYDFSDYYFYDRAYGLSPSAGIFSANSSPVYKVEFLDGSLWTSQGIYGSERSAMAALMSFTSRKTGRLWRMVCDDGGKILVLALIQG